MSNHTNDKDSNDLIDSFLIDGGYLDEDGKPDLNAWMADSDYTIGENEWLEVVWFYDGNQVDAVDCILAAIEACEFQRDWIVTIDVACTGHDPVGSLIEWIACNGSENLVDLVARYENPVTGYSVGW